MKTLLKNGMLAILTLVMVQSARATGLSSSDSNSENNFLTLDDEVLAPNPSDDDEDEPGDDPSDDTRERRDYRDRDHTYRHRITCSYADRFGRYFIGVAQFRRQAMRMASSKCYRSSRFPRTCHFVRCNYR